MTGRSLAAAALGFCVAAALTGCAASRGTAAAPRPPRVPGEVTSGPDLAGVKLPDFTMPLITGGVSRPRPGLTPGAVATRNTTAICRLPGHQAAAAIPAAAQDAVFREYGYVNPQVQSKYDIDYLVPVLLGGATTIKNMWPAAYKGTGYFEKVQLDHVLRDMVCRRTLSLAAAQRALEKNWYVAWLTYVVATGRA